MILICNTLLLANTMRQKRKDALAAVIKRNTLLLLGYFRDIYIILYFISSFDLKI